jgi:hypothetical protein
VLVLAWASPKSRMVRVLALAQAILNDEGELFNISLEVAVDVATKLDCETCPWSQDFRKTYAPPNE